VLHAGHQHGLALEALVVVGGDHVPKLPGHHLCRRPPKPTSSTATACYRTWVRMRLCPIMLSQLHLRLCNIKCACCCRQSRPSCGLSGLVGVATPTRSCAHTLSIAPVKEGLIRSAREAPACVDVLMHVKQTEAVRSA